MRILVTGSHGHIGKPFVAAAQAVGHTVRTFDRPEEALESAPEHVSGDICDIAAVRAAMQGVDAVVHLASLASHRRGKGEDVLRINVEGTWNVLFACVDAGVRRAVCFSSINALGCAGGYRPAVHLPIDDAYPRHPMTPYHLSKHLGEETCRSFSDRHGIVTICLRPVFVAGEQRRLRPVSTAAENDQRAEKVKVEYWAYVDMPDVCDATLRSLTVEGVTHDAFLLTAADTMMDTPTAELVQRYYPDTPWPKVSMEAYLAGNPYRSLMDCSHAKEVLGWVPQHSWREAQEDTK